MNPERSITSKPPLPSIPHTGGLLDARVFSRSYSASAVHPTGGSGNATGSGGLSETYASAAGSLIINADFSFSGSAQQTGTGSGNAELFSTFHTDFDIVGGPANFALLGEFLPSVSGLPELTLENLGTAATIFSFSGQMPALSQTGILDPGSYRLTTTIQVKSQANLFIPSDAASGSYDYTLSIVPEPSWLGLLGIGLLASALRRRHELA